MGNQVTSNQHEPVETPKQLITRQPVKRKGRQVKKPRWLAAGKPVQQSAPGAATSSPSKTIDSEDSAKKVSVAENKRERQAQPPTSLVQSLADDAADKTASKAKDNSAPSTAVVIAEMTPTPDSANRTWSDEASLPPHLGHDAKHSPEVEEKAAEPIISGHRQRDSGISQLSTEEFERAFEELAARCLVEQQHSSPVLAVKTSDTPTDTEVEVLELLGPRLRPKRSPTLRKQARGAADATAAAIVATEEQLLLRQELLLLTPSSAGDSGRHSACSVVNDDHLFPDSVTPCKVDSGLLTDYDVPYMDDETFFVLDDWYITDDRRWSYLRRSGTPQLANWDDCQLTISAPISPKATPRVGHRSLFGLCFGLKSRA